MTIENAWKNGMFVLFDFKIDSLFQNLLRALKLYKPRMGFGSMTNCLISTVGIKDDHSRDVLPAIGYIRNTFHNNGIHRADPLTVRMEDLDFVFLKDAAINCASWAHIFAAMYKTIDIVDRILLSEKIKAMPTTIEDKYASNPNDDWMDPVDYGKQIL